MNSFCRRSTAWTDAVGWVWVWGDKGWACCSGHAYDVDGWRMSCCREWKTPFCDCSQLPAYQPGNATTFNFAYAVAKPWAGPRQVSVTGTLSGREFDARIANRIRKSGCAFFCSGVWAEHCASRSRGRLNLPGFTAFETLASITCISTKVVPGWSFSKRRLCGEAKFKTTLRVTGCSNTLEGL